MKQKVHVARLKRRAEASEFAVHQRLNDGTHSNARPNHPTTQVSTIAPSDISGVGSSTFHALGRKYEQDIESISESPQGNIPERYKENRIKGKRGNNLGELLFQGDGFHTEGSPHNIIVAKNFDDNNRRSRFERRKRLYVHFPCPRRIFFAICLLAFGLIVPITMVKVFEVSEPARNDSVANVSNLLAALGVTARHSEGQALWTNHVVIGDGNRLLIPETFESRLNADVAPLLEQHVTKVWDLKRYPELVCQTGEHLMVAFSLVKSASLPASISYERPCTPHPNSRKCVHEKRVSDVRDLVVILPSKSSRYTYSVKVAEDRAGSSGKSKIPLPRRFQPLGTISGPFKVELSDGSKLAVQRYCGTDRNNVAEDLDIEQVTKDNTRLLTIYELKRLHALWAKQRERFIGERQHTWKQLQLSKATIDPTEHSRHSISILDLKKVLSSAIASSADATQLEYSPSFQSRGEQAFDDGDSVGDNASHDGVDEREKMLTEDSSTETDSPSTTRGSTRESSMSSPLSMDGESRNEIESTKGSHEDTASETNTQSNNNDMTTPEMHASYGEQKSDILGDESDVAGPSAPIENKTVKPNALDGLTHSATSAANLERAMTPLQQRNALRTKTAAMTDSVNLAPHPGVTRIPIPFSGINPPRVSQQERAHPTPQSPVLELAAPQVNTLEPNENETHNDVVAESSALFRTEKSATIDLQSARDEPAPGKNLPQTRGVIEKPQFEVGRISTGMHPEPGYPHQYRPITSSAYAQLRNPQRMPGASPPLAQGHVNGRNHGWSKDQLRPERAITNNKWTHQGTIQSRGHMSEVQRLRQGKFPFSQGKAAARRSPPRTSIFDQNQQDVKNLILRQRATGSTEQSSRHPTSGRVRGSYITESGTSHYAGPKNPPAARHVANKPRPGFYSTRSRR